MYLHLYNINIFIFRIFPFNRKTHLQIQHFIFLSLVLFHTSHQYKNCVLVLPSQRRQRQTKHSKDFQPRQKDKESFVFNMLTIVQNI